MEAVPHFWRIGSRRAGAGGLALTTGCGGFFSVCAWGEHSQRHRQPSKGFSKLPARRFGGKTCSLVPQTTRMTTGT